MGIISEDIIISSSQYFPESTGENQSQTQVASSGDNNTQPSTLNTDSTTFSPLLHNNALQFPSGIYDTGNITLSSTEYKFTNSSSKPISIKVNINVDLRQLTSINSSVVGIRLNSSGGIGTGTTRFLSGGITPGGVNFVKVSSTILGAFTVMPGDSFWLEGVSNTVGDVFVDGLLCIISLIY